MPDGQPHSPQGFSARRDQPLIGVVVPDGDREIVRYFTDEAEADEALSQSGIAQALSLAGAWKDIDSTEALDELERLRHESRPTPPIDLAGIAD
jgi:hypothetical protein